MIAFLIGAAIVAFFEGHSSFQCADALKAPGEGEHYCSFEMANEDQTEINQRLLEALDKLREKELERQIRFKEITAKHAAEIRREANGTNKQRNEFRTIAFINAQCRREGRSPLQCEIKKITAAFDIEKNVLPRYNSFPNAASFDEWQLKRRIDKQAAEVLFDENAGLGGM